MAELVLTLSRPDQAARWLSGQSRKTAAVLATRTVLRELPEWIFVLRGEVRSQVGDFFTTTFVAAHAAWLNTELSASGGDIVHDPGLRRRVHPLELDEELNYAAHQNMESFALRLDGALRASVALGYAAVDSAADDFARQGAVDATHHLDRTDHWRAFVADSKMETARGAQVRSLVHERLWLGEEEVPQAVDTLWSVSRGLLEKRQEDWQVWTTWYEDRLHGRPFDRDLEIARAKLCAETWETPPADLNAAIRRLIEDRRAALAADLHGALDRLEDQRGALPARQPRAPGLGHNQPPEAIEDALGAVAPDLDALRAAPETREEAKRIAGAARRVKSALGAMLGYAGEKLDLFISEVVKEAGKQTGGWAIKLAAAGFAAQQLGLLGTLAKVVEAAAALLRAFGIGL